MIYLDNASTTKPCRKAIKAATDAMEKYWYNPSAIYDCANMVSVEIKQARNIISTFMKCKPSEVIFTSGATEGNNMVLLSDWDEIITTPIEHASVSNTVLNFKKHTEVKIDKSGKVCLEDLENKLKVSTGKVLVSIIAVNNEIGTIQDIASIKRLCDRYDTYLHLDCTQVIGKIHLGYNYADYITCSAHKFHGIKGTGFLVMRKPLKTLITGGHQENEHRAGTENVPGILAMSEALKELYNNIDDNVNYVDSLKSTMLHELKKIDDWIVNSDKNNPYILSVSFKNINAESLVLMLSLKGICISSGSACNSKAQKASKVLKAIGLSDDYLYGTIRISFSHENTVEEVLTAANAICDCVKSIRHSRGVANEGREILD